MYGIVPPYLLERLTQHPDGGVARCAVRTLRADATLREQRLATPARGSVGVRSVGRGQPAPQRTIADAKTSTQLPGVTVRKEGESPTGDAAADQAYDGLGLTWAMLFESFGRDSLDGAGMPMLATVHYGQQYDNAFWNGERMVFGDGDGEVFTSFTGAVDIIGHELAHGLIQSTVDLAYQGQSGALNESVADVIGSLTKQHALGQRAAEADWLVGAGIFTARVQGEALRSLKAPGTAYDDDVLGKDQQPATMAGYVETQSDNGGVHINSGIPNHAFYLAATGIGGYAWEGAGQVWLDVLGNRAVGPRADFPTFAKATRDAAIARFGRGSREAAAVADAWARVGVGEPGGVSDSTPSDGGETVRVERSGGMLGRARVGTVPESALPGDDQVRLNALISSGRLLALQEERMPDAYVWHVHVERRIDVTVVEPALPQDVLTLLRRILELGETGPS